MSAKQILATDAPSFDFAYERFICHNSISLVPKQKKTVNPLRVNYLQAARVARVFKRNPIHRQNALTFAAIHAELAPTLEAFRMADAKLLPPSAIV